MIPKFRAWHKEWKSMLNADDVWIIDFQSRCIQYDVDEYVMCIVDFKDIHLMQSTGLFDANGREVFAGDIVLINRPPFDCQGVVKYYNGCWWIVCGGIAFSLYDEVEESLVIGNIYENKELLEGTE